ncbi:TRAM domain-containing protein [Haloplanus halobius]
MARIGPGYVVFVEETQPGDHVKIRVTEARDNFAFAEVVDRV